jgi:hypothetical protein
MVKTNLKLWEKLSNFSLDNPEASFSFTDRLARENGWSIEFSKRVIDEYKKFIYMSVVSGKSLTPSDEVDQAWHLHLVYSYSYWVEMCENTLGGFRLHHGPTKGGVTEKNRYDNQYSQTLEFYRNEFGSDAPRDIWPSHDVRFGKVNFRRVSMHDNYVLNKEKVKKHMLNMATVLFSLFGAALFLSAKPSESEGDVSILIWSIVIAIGVYFVIRGLYRYSTRRSRSNRYTNTSSRYNSSSSSSSKSSSNSSSSSDSGCTVVSSFFGCGSSSSGCGSSSSSSGCGSSGCGSSGCGGGGCGGCGG